MVQQLISHLLINDEEYQFEGGKKSKKTVDDGDETDSVKAKVVGFECIPSQFKEVPGNEAKKIRTTLMIMLFAHIGFLCCELFLYNTMISQMFSEMFYGWLCYYCFQTMNTCALYSYMVVLGLAAVLGVLNILFVGGWFLIYIGQLAVYCLCAYHLWGRMQKYTAEKNGVKQDKKKKKKGNKEPLNQQSDDDNEAVGGQNFQDKIANQVSDKVAANIIKSAKQQGKDAFKKINN